ncbi:MAG: hypothetical protein LBG89_02655 [Rickettsiales bacterium]|jgi:ABC-type transporter Mla subunit MlaD|nr:hypothetical protein [Rickettsiales bacterium]
MNDISILAMVAAGFFGLVMLLAVRAVARSARAANALSEILMHPARAKMSDAKLVLDKLSEKYLESVSSLIARLSETLSLQTRRADEIYANLTKDNAALVGAANGAADRLSGITRILDARLANFHKVVNSETWNNLAKTSNEFGAEMKGLFQLADHLSMEVSDRVDKIRGSFEDWTEDSKRLNASLSAGLESNTAQMNSFNIECEGLKSLMDAAAEKFGKVRGESEGLEETLRRNEKLVDAHLDKVAGFTRQSKMLLDQQLGGLTNTASAVGSQIRLAESSIDKQQQILEKSVQTLMEHATDTEGYVKGISTQITTLTGRLQSEVKEMIEGMLESLGRVSDNANAALADTGRAEIAFKENVAAMTAGIKDAIAQLGAMNARMMSEGGGMMEMSKDVAARLQPLAELIAGYHNVLPELGKNSEEITGKLRNLSQATNESIVGMANSSLKLEKLTEQSRQMMMELLSDYSDALGKMEKLSHGMTIARAAPVSSDRQPRRSPQGEDGFMAGAHTMMEKLNEISVDLVQAANAEIPEQIWDRYRAGDKAVFAKWFAKMVSGADKQKFQALFKSDAAFRGNATHFMRGFHKMLLDAAQDDNKDAITATLLKTDIGRIYLAMKELIS